VSEDVPDLIELGVATRRDGLLILGECGLYMDLAPDAAVAPGDWIATEAGSRYVVMTARRVNRRKHAQQARWQMRVGKLARGLEPPGDVVVWWLHWYRRGRG
jgi:hypothetical protein